MSEAGERGEAGSEAAAPEAAASGAAASEAAAPVGWLPRAADALFGEGATASEAYGLLTVDVPSAAWTDALTTARDELGCRYFDWLSAVDEPDTGFSVCAHVVAVGTPVRRLLLRTTVPHDAPSLPTATPVYAGAAWHERETHEMFGVAFEGHPHLVPLLLPDGFEGHPLRKDFVLAARVAKAWPGAKEPGESGHGGPKRRQMQPPGVPDPNEWGPLKGQLPPAPTRGPRGAGDRPRRARSAGAGSASQREGAPPRRTRTAGEGPASQAPPRRSRTAGEGSASQRPSGPPAEDTTPPPTAAASPSEAPNGDPATRPRRSPDAPWHNPRAGTPPEDEAPTEQTGGPGAGTPPTDAPPTDASPTDAAPRPGASRSDDDPTHQPRPSAPAEDEGPAGPDSGAEDGTAADDGAGAGKSGSGEGGSDAEGGSGASPGDGDQTGGEAP